MSGKMTRMNKAVSLLLVLSICMFLLTLCAAAVLAEAAPQSVEAESENAAVESGLPLEGEADSGEAQEQEESPASAEEQAEIPNTGKPEKPQTEETPVTTEGPAASDEPEPTQTPGTTEQPDATNEPSQQPTQKPTASPTAEPTAEPTASPTPEPPAVIPAGAYTISITPPAKWQTGKATARIQIEDENGTGWANIRIVLATPNAWTAIVDGDDQEKEYVVELRENSTLYVSITDHAGNVQAKSEVITCFDRIQPTVRVGVSGEVICIEASDSISGVEAVYVNGHRLSYAGNTLDAKIRDYADGKEKISIQAVDKAGNYSEVVDVKNPFYGQEEKPVATKKPAAGSSGSKKTPKPKTTPKPTATPEATALPIVTPDPTMGQGLDSSALSGWMEQYLESMISAPSEGSPFTMNGNMKTLDLLYSKATNKQFITVQTKKGETYYIVIDYDKPLDEDGELYETYFLNLVDDRDLLSVLSESDYATPEPTATPVPTPEPTPAPTPQPTEEPEQVQKDTGAAGVLALLLLILIGGGAAVFMKMKKNKVGTMPDIDDFDLDDDDEAEQDTE